MALVNKPDESIFASSAKQGEVDNFPDLLRGWGITFDQTQGIPPMEWFNFLFKRLDEKHTYLMQRGLPEWSATQDYTKGSCVQFEGLSYRALKNSKNNSPNESNSQYWVRWGFALSEIAQATLTQYGITKLYTGYDSQREDLALTPKTAYQLKQLIDSNTRSLSNVIPNSKKSSAVNSNSADTVATSAAVKTAYDKGIEARIAAYAANNNANGRVSKSGDEMSGNLVVASSYSGGFAKGVIVKNKAGGKGTSGFVDFYQTDNAPRASLWFRDLGNGSCDVEILTSPEGSNINEDKRDLHTKFNPDGSLWVKKYGFLHDYFMTRGDFSSSWYPNHYAGTEVYKIRHLGLMITVMNLGTGNAGEYYLPEAYNGYALAWVTDNGGARGVGVSGVYDGNKIRLHGGNTISRSVLVIGRKYW